MLPDVLNQPVVTFMRPAVSLTSESSLERAAGILRESQMRLVPVHRGNEFLGVVSDAQWKVFCDAFELAVLGADPALAANNDRVLARETFIPQVRATLKACTKAELLAKLEGLGLPFAPIARPEELASDPHLSAAGGLVEITLASGETTRLPALPLEMAGARFAIRSDVPGAGEHSAAVLEELGFEPETIEALRMAKVVA